LLDRKGKARSKQQGHRACSFAYQAPLRAGHGWGSNGPPAAFPTFGHHLHSAISRTGKIKKKKPGATAARESFPRTGRKNRFPRHHHQKSARPRNNDSRAQGPKFEQGRPRNRGSQAAPPSHSAFSVSGRSQSAGLSKARTTHANGGRAGFVVSVVSLRLEERACLAIPGCVHGFTQIESAHIFYLHMATTYCILQEYIRFAFKR